jgi:hypothetical protein
VGFEPKIPVFERAKTVHALDRGATVIGASSLVSSILPHTIFMKSRLTTDLPEFQRSRELIAVPMLLEVKTRSLKGIHSCTATTVFIKGFQYFRFKYLFNAMN